jgi:hypothetical protein
MIALISKIEPREQGWRVVQVNKDDEGFEVTNDYFWFVCPDNIIADKFWFNPIDSSFQVMPIPEPVPSTTMTQGLEQI